MTDVGGLGLALAVVLGAAALRMERGLVQAALAGYLVYSVSHLAFHATHLAGLPATDAALLLTGLALLPAFALALLLIAARATAPDGREQQSEGKTRSPTPCAGAAVKRLIRGTIAAIDLRCTGSRKRRRRRRYRSCCPGSRRWPTRSRSCGYRWQAGGQREVVSLGSGSVAVSSSARAEEVRPVTARSGRVLPPHGRSGPPG
jgi:hypothetical protein